MSINYTKIAITIIIIMIGYLYVKLWLWHIVYYIGPLSYVNIYIYTTFAASGTVNYVYTTFAGSGNVAMYKTYVVVVYCTYV